MTFLVDTQMGAPSITPVYIEDLFSTWRYTGTGATQTVTTNIDLSTKGGMTWIKSRSAATVNKITDTVRGATKGLVTSTTAAQTTDTNGLTAFSTTGFTLGTDTIYNNTSATYVAWNFKKQPKFFDIVTYTGTGSATTIAHNLGSTPGCIMVKRTDTTGNWEVYHSGMTSASYYMRLNSTAAQTLDTAQWNATAPTSTVFSVGTNTGVNASGGTYVAYLFASNAGGFGASGADNIITCGSFTTDVTTAAASVNLGYEPQFMLIKSVSTTGLAGDWNIFDYLRGMPVYPAILPRLLNPNTALAEFNGTYYCYPTATGFEFQNDFGNQKFIYIAIRRGPMKTPTAGTQVLSIKNYAATNVVSTATVTHDVTYDVDFSANRDATTAKFLFVDLLRGPDGYVLRSNSTSANNNFPTFWSRINNRTSAAVSATDAFWASASAATNNHISYGMVRSPGVFDQVAFVGTGTNLTLNHILGVAPELIIVKKASAASTTGWVVGATALGYGNKLYLNLTNASAADATAFNSTAPTSTTFTVGTNTDCNASGASSITYLFATLAGVSKVGTYSGTGATQTINCGFTGGARWVMIKRTDTTGDWYVWDTVRGMVAGTDPSLLFNTTGIEVNANSVYTVSTGFQIVSTAAGINASGGTYLYMAFS
jgi:hypothetical protein